MPNRATAAQVADLVGPITKLLERRLVASAESAIAALALWTLECVEGQRLRPDLADEVFTLLVVYVGDHSTLPPLSDEAQELLLEGQHFHHWRDPIGSDAALMRNLAEGILKRSAEPLPAGRSG